METGAETAAAVATKTQVMSSALNKVLRFNISMSPFKTHYGLGGNFNADSWPGNTKSRAAFFIMGRQKIFNTEEKRKQRI